MRFLIFTILSAAASLAHAQHAGENFWLNADYTYSQITYKEPNATQKGNLAGIRGDFGIGLLENFGITSGGEYRDGNFNYDGSTYNNTDTNTKLVTSDYMRDTYAQANLMLGPITISGGVGQSEWFNHVNGSYRRRLTADYYPASITLYRAGFYVKGEAFVRKSGHSQVYMHDVNPNENDVDLKQNSGNGYGGEIGLIFPNYFHFRDRIFIGYKHWDVAAGDSQSDGVRVVALDKYSLEIWQAGLGFNF